MEQTLEQKAAAAILEKPIGTIIANGQTYDIMPPTTATLIEVSALASTLPPADKPDEAEADILQWVMANAKDCGPTIGKIAATLILGAKRMALAPAIEAERPGRLSALLRALGFGSRTRRVNERDSLAQALLMELTPEQMKDIIYPAIIGAGVGDFFLLTASLCTRNILKKTKTEAATATASGLS